ncbi:hypothetical protein ACOMHN_061164 [Nucella lapillus]
MHRYRGRPRQEDIELRERMMERDRAYECEYEQRMYHDAAYDELDYYEPAYREGIYEQGYEERMYEWDMEHKKRMHGRRMFMEDPAYHHDPAYYPDPAYHSDRAYHHNPAYHYDRAYHHDPAYRHERVAMGGEGEYLPPPREGVAAPVNPREDCFAGPEGFDAYREGRDEGQHSWNPDGEWSNAEGGSGSTGWHDEDMGQGEGSYPGAGGRDDQDHGEDEGEMEDGEEAMTQEQKTIFKLKHCVTIPLCYVGPCFHSDFSEYTIQLSPIIYSDTIKPCFSSIRANAKSVRIILGSKKNGCLMNSCLVLMAKSSNVKLLMRGILMQDFSSESFAVSVEQRKAETFSEEVEHYPTVVHKASFRVNNKAIRAHMNRAMIPDDNSSEKQSAVHLHNLPKSVDWTFLRNLFPLGLNGQVIEGEPRSAFVQMRSPKMALIHVASITSLKIDGQPVDMKTDMPPLEVVKLLQEVEDEATPTPSAPKKKKKNSPSDIRRNLRKKAELEQRMAKHMPQCVAPPPFPGMPNLLNMSFHGPGNMPPPHAPAGASAFAGRGTPGTNPYPSTPTYTAVFGTEEPSGVEGDDSSEFQVPPIPQLLEGSYRPASDYYAPGTPSEPGTSQKLRTPSYFRRNRARTAVNLAHLWGGDIKAAGNALTRSALPEDQRPPAVYLPPYLLTLERLTEYQLNQLKKRVQGLCSIHDLFKAEDYWQRKRKDREAAGLSMLPQATCLCAQQAQAALEAEIGEETSPEKSRARIEYNRKIRAVTKSEGNADSGAVNNPTSAATETGSAGSQRIQWSSGQAGHWSQQQTPSDTPPTQPRPYRAISSTTSPRTLQLYHSQHKSSMPPPPPPQAPSPRPAPLSAQKRFHQPSDQNQPAHSRFSRSHPHPSSMASQGPVPPKPAQPYQGEYPHQASPKPAQSYQGEYPHQASSKPYQGEYSQQASSKPYQGEYPHQASPKPYQGEYSQQASVQARHQASSKLALPYQGEYPHQGSSNSKSARPYQGEYSHQASPKPALPYQGEYSQQASVQARHQASSKPALPYQGEYSHQASSKPYQGEYSHQASSKSYQGEYSHQASSNSKPALPYQGEYSHQASPKTSPSSQTPFSSAPTPRPSSAPQYPHSQPPSSWKPASASGSASRPLAQNPSSQKRLPPMSQQQRSWLGPESQFQRQQRQQQQQQQ